MCLNFISKQLFQTQVHCYIFSARCTFPDPWWTFSGTAAHFRALGAHVPTLGAHFQARCTFLGPWSALSEPCGWYFPAWYHQPEGISAIQEESAGRGRQAKVDSKVWYRVRAFRRMSPKAPPASITLISHWASYNVSTPPTPGPANTTENTDPYQSRFLAFFWNLGKAPQSKLKIE